MRIFTNLPWFLSALCFCLRVMLLMDSHSSTSLLLTLESSALSCVRKPTTVSGRSNCTFGEQMVHSFSEILIDLCALIPSTVVKGKLAHFFNESYLVITRGKWSLILSAWSWKVFLAKWARKLKKPFAIDLEIYI